VKLTLSQVNHVPRGRRLRFVLQEELNCWGIEATVVSWAHREWWKMNNSHNWCYNQIFKINYYWNHHFINTCKRSHKIVAIYPWIMAECIQKFRHRLPAYMNEKLFLSTAQLLIVHAHVQWLVIHSHPLGLNSATPSQLVMICLWENEHWLVKHF